MLTLARQEGLKLLQSKTLKPIIEKISFLKTQTFPKTDFILENGLKIIFENPLSQDQKNLIKNTALSLKPWRKGPFYIDDCFIDTEWKSFLKYDIISKHIKLEGKEIADIGCNNGYYMFNMLKSNPKNITGFDPSGIYKCQFDFINFFLKTKIIYELLGIEHLNIYEKKFDVIFCLGVLYHRSDPIIALKSLKNALNKNGEIILDTLILDGEDEIALCPKNSYAKMPNVYFIPTIKTLQGWCERVGFKRFEILATSKTTTNEQRKTLWIDGLSLESFLDSEDTNKTQEGYPAPKRGYFKLKKE